MVAAGVKPEKKEAPALPAAQIAKVREAIQLEYGFVAPDAYITDLVNFVKEIIAGRGELSPLLKATGASATPAASSQAQQAAEKIREGSHADADRARTADSNP